MASSSKKTAVLLCCIPSHEVVDGLLQALRRNGYHVPLLITCPLAFNYSMTNEAIKDMGNTISAIVDKVWDPPPILTCTNTKQIEDIYCAIDPDFALSCYFAYPVSKKMLGMRAKIVNLHPGRFPIERGPFPGLWPALRAEQGYSMDDLCATFHYMNEKVDCGPIIKEIPLKDKFPAGTTLTTLPSGVLDLAILAWFEHLDEVIRMVEDGFEGYPQEQPARAPQDEEGKGYGARKPTDEERTIQGSWKRDEVLHLVHTLNTAAEGIAPAYYWWNGRRYWIERAVAWDWPSSAKKAKVGDVKRLGFDLLVMFEGGAVRLATRTR